MANCPKCGVARPEGVSECPQCGVIYARMEAAAAKKRAAEEAERSRAEEAARQAAEAEKAAPSPPKRRGLVVCPACFKSVSGNAEACPNCGEPIRENPNLVPAGGSLGFKIAMMGVLAFAVGLGCLLWWGEHESPSAKYEAKRSAPIVKKPNIRTNVPFTIPEDATNILGCHDIDDYWMLRGAIQDGRDALRAQLRPRVADGRCGTIAAGRGIAIEILPTGVAEIRDSRGAKWYIHASAIEDYEGH